MDNDRSRQDATSPDSEYSLTIEDAGWLYDQADLPRTPRTIQRYCEKGHLASRLVDTSFGSEKYLITPASVARHIAYLKEVGPASTRRVVSRHDATDVIQQNNDEEPRQEAPTRLDLSRQVATHIVEENKDDKRRQLDPTESDLSRQVATDLDIFEHPYVKRLEAEVEKWQGKFEEQVQRTQKVLETANENLIQLQQAAAVANSQTLADFLLKAGRFLKSPFASGEGEPDTTEEAPH
jgi:hypothetical protein